MQLFLLQVRQHALIRQARRLQGHRRDRADVDKILAAAGGGRLEKLLRAGDIGLENSLLVGLAERNQGGVVDNGVGTLQSRQVGGRVVQLTVQQADLRQLGHRQVRAARRAHQHA